ncbi:MAG: hypothetical protein J0L86_16795 [Flavobacteriales bacterium]|nr:hypothetical protein [Flavobacteriales bacterium]
MAHDFPYKSLHEYLDSIFKGVTPSENDIIQAKKSYWKAYNTRLKQHQRKKRKEITIALDKKEWEALLQRRSTNQSIHDYIKEWLTHHISNSPIVTNTIVQDTSQIEQQLFVVCDYLEGLVYQRRHIDNNSIATLEQLLYKLQKLLEDKF